MNKDLRIILLAIIIAVIVVIIFQSYSDGLFAVEKYRVKARAFSSCPPDNCQTKAVKPDDLLIINPFVWPYSGGMAPAEVLSKHAPDGMLKSEPDHEAPTN